MYWPLNVPPARTRISTRLRNQQIAKASRHQSRHEAMKVMGKSIMPSTIAPQPASTSGNKIDLEPEFWQTLSPYHPARPLKSVVSRFEEGKALRARTPREAHADWTP